jgi:hypothetical protein
VPRPTVRATGSPAAAGAAGAPAGAEPPRVGPGLADPRQHGADRHRLALGHHDLQEHPVVGAGISESTLSVETSNSGSSKSIASPTCFFQEPTVPSVTVSPSLGMVISCTTPLGTDTPGASRFGPLEPPICGAAGSFMDGAAAAGDTGPGLRRAAGTGDDRGRPVAAREGRCPVRPMRTRACRPAPVSPSGTMISRITPS